MSWNLAGPPSGAAGRQGPRHTPALDGFRGLAILLVLFFHLTPVGFWAHHVSVGGWLGVDLFFVLSGFLITGILLDGKGQPHPLRNFYARRFLRIFPLYYLILAVLMYWVVPAMDPTAATDMQAHRWWFWLFGTNFLIAPGLSFPWADHFWSLAVEEHFYLVWPWVVHFTSPRALVRIGLVGVFCAMVLRLGLQDTYSTTAIYMLTQCRFDALVIGGLLAIYRRRPDGPGKLRAFTRFGVVPVTVVFVIASVFFHFFSRANPYFVVFGYTAISLMGMGLLNQVLEAPAGHPLAKIFGSPVLRFLGHYSYGLYLIHVPVSRAAEALLLPQLRPAWGVLALPLYWTITVSISLVLAMASWHLYEKWFLRLKKYF